MCTFSVVCTAPPSPSPRLPCGNTDESVTHIVKECEPHKEERNALTGGDKENTRCDMKKFGALLRRSIVNRGKCLDIVDYGVISLSNLRRYR